MDSHWTDDAIRAMSGTEVEYKNGWNSIVFKLGGKMFGMRGSYKDGRPILTIKLPPEQGEMLREQFEHIIPGYYSNKLHWNSIFLDVDYSQDFIAELLEDSYDCVFGSLPKKTQARLDG